MKDKVAQTKVYVTNNGKKSAIAKEEAKAYTLGEVSVVTILPILNRAPARGPQTSSKSRVGDRFGRLVIKSVSYTGKGDTRAICDCDCGEKDVSVRVGNLVSGAAKSCGCILHETNVKSGKRLSDWSIGEYWVGDTQVSSLHDTVRSDNKTGVTGVQLDSRTGRYIATLQIAKLRVHLGSHATIEEAAEVRRDAEDRYHGTIIRAYESGGLEEAERVLNLIKAELTQKVDGLTKRTKEHLDRLHAKNRETNSNIDIIVGRMEKKRHTDSGIQKNSKFKTYRLNLTLLKFTCRLGTYKSLTKAREVKELFYSKYMLDILHLLKDGNIDEVKNLIEQCKADTRNKDGQ